MRETAPAQKFHKTPNFDRACVTLGVRSCGRSLLEIFTPYPLRRSGPGPLFIGGRL